MRFASFGYGKLFRLKTFSDQLYLSTRPTCCPTAAFPTRSPSAFGQSVTMHSGRNVTSSTYSDSESYVADKVEVFGAVPTSAEGDCPPAEKKRVSNKLVSEMKLSAFNSITGANCDEDSEAESFKDGRSVEVDSETRGRAYTWCREFLSGSWKTLDEEDFRISIVR